MTGWSRREKVVLALAIAVGTIFTADRLVISSSLEGLRNLDNQIAVKEARLVRDSRTLAQKDQILTDHRQIRTRPKTGKRDDMTSLLNEVESAARSTGVRLKDIRPQSEGRNLILSISTEAPWDATVRLILRLQRSPEMLQIARATLQRQNNEGGTISMQLTISKSGAS